MRSRGLADLLEGIQNGVRPGRLADLLRGGAGQGNDPVATNTAQPSVVRTTPVQIAPTLANSTIASTTATGIAPGTGIGGRPQTTFPAFVPPPPKGTAEVPDAPVVDSTTVAASPTAPISMPAGVLPPSSVSGIPSGSGGRGTGIGGRPQTTFPEFVPGSGSQSTALDGTVQSTTTTTVVVVQPSAGGDSSPMMSLSSTEQSTTTTTVFVQPSAEGSQGTTVAPIGQPASNSTSMELLSNSPPVAQSSPQVEVTTSQAQTSAVPPPAQTNQPQPVVTPISSPILDALPPSQGSQAPPAAASGSPASGAMPPNQTAQPSPVTTEVARM